RSVSPSEHILCSRVSLLVLFLNAPPTPEISTLSLHDALPICPVPGALAADATGRHGGAGGTALSPSRFVDQWCAGIHRHAPFAADRKSTRLNSSHVKISYAVFCLKKKKTK